VDKQESVFEELVAAHATLGEVHWYEGRLVAAESQLTRALVINAAIDSRDDDALHVLADREALIRLRGLVYMSLGRSADARIAFELALRLSSDLARQSLGVEDRDQGSRIPLVRNQIYLAVFFEQGDGSAIRSLDNAITLIHEIEARLESADLTVMSTAHPSASWNPIPARQQLQWIEAEALLWKGRMLQASGDKPGAHNCFVESVSLLEPIARDFPDIFWTRTQLAASYGYLGTTVDRAEADKHFATAATLAEGIPDVKRVRGHVFNIVAWCMVSECLADRDYHLAVQYAHVAVECMPECRTYNTLGVALYRSGRFEEAITALNESYRRETVKGGYNAFFLAMAEWRLGNVHVSHKWFDDASSSVERSPTMVKWDLSRFRKEAAELLGIPPLAPTATLQ
jgi:tetratricopeptide (TPR) repeat protein